jgi:hypothetical protein
MIRLTEPIIKSIRTDRRLKNKLLTVLDVSERSLQSYLDGNSERFTTLDALNTIVEHTQMPLSSIIEGGKVSKLLMK